MRKASLSGGFFISSFCRVSWNREGTVSFQKISFTFYIFVLTATVAVLTLRSTNLNQRPTFVLET